MKAAQERLRAAAVAAGEEKADLALRSGRVLDVHTGQVVEADVAIVGARVATVGEIDHCVGADTETLDCAGLVLVPGFIDPHIHVGGSQLTIERLAEVLVPLGTAAICTDFYEPGSIAGRQAVEELLARSEGTGLDILLSVFHATALGLGAFGNLGRFSPEDLLALVRNEATVAIREWNFGASKIPIPELETFYEEALRAKHAVEGHLEGLSGPPLQASIALGVVSDHETVTPDQAVEMIRLGVNVQLREGSGAKDLDTVVRAITEHGNDPRNFSLCTDEQELESLVHHGYMDHKLRMVTEHGIPPVEAVRMATIGPARTLGVALDYGSISPGKIASIAGLRDLREFRVELMVSSGVVSAREGEYLLEPAIEPYPEAWYDTVHVHRTLTADDFLFDPRLTEPTMRVIGVTPGSLVTEELVERVLLDQGRLASPDGSLAKIAVIDRHDGGEHATLGLISGFRIREGALAATINPGMMDLMVLGVDEEDMAAAANRVVELKGGMAVAHRGEVRAEVATPVFGIMSDAPSADVAARCEEVVAAIQEDLGSPVEGLLTSAGFACLAVIIPNLKISARGLVRVSRDGGQEGVDVLVEP